MNSDSRIPLVLSGIGAAFAGVLIGEGFAIWTITGTLLIGLFWVSAATTAPFIGASVYGGYWLRHSDIPESRYRRILGWAVGGLVGFVCLNLLTIWYTEPLNVFELAGWLRWAGALGAGTGTVLGIVEARAIQRAVQRERIRVRAVEAETREELLTYLHNLLRHKVRNSVNAIDGHAALLANEADANGDYAAAIERQTDELTTITQEIRTLLEASGAEVELRPHDLRTLIGDELAAIETEYDGVDVEFDCPADATVVGGNLIDRIFRNLIVNAVVHDPADVSEVKIEVEEVADYVVIQVEDDGPGIPDRKRDRLFDLNRGGTPEKGLGLPLVRILVERYGGTIELTSSGDDGTVFTVKLPRPGVQDADSNAEYLRAFAGA